VYPINERFEIHLTSPKAPEKKKRTEKLKNASATNRSNFESLLHIERKIVLEKEGDGRIPNCIALPIT